MSKVGFISLVASGDEIPNGGEMTLNMVFDVKAQIRRPCQAAKVMRPLMSISKICDNDNGVLFMKIHVLCEIRKESL